MNPLYLFYLINKDVFSPDMEGTQYGYRLYASSGFVSKNANYNTSPVIPISEYTKVVFNEKEVSVFFSTQTANIYPAIRVVILILYVLKMQNQWLSAIL